MRVKNVTGTVILAAIAAIFGTDAVLDGTGHATISEWFHNWLTSNPTVNLPVFLAGVALLLGHFWWFRPHGR